MAEDPRNTIGISREELKELCRRYDRELSGVKDWMFWFLLVWTLVLLGMEWRQFFGSDAVPPAIAAGYMVLLSAYVVHKEVLRWSGVALRIRRGEVFVYLWWGMLLLMYLIEYLGGRSVVSEGMRTLSYEVLGAFILSEISKAYNAWHIERSSLRER